MEYFPQSWRYRVTSTLHHFLLGMGVLLMAGLAIGDAEQSGPTPYPDKADAASWPGDGPIRVFNWMTDNRNYFWTQREKDLGTIVFVGDSLVGGWKDVRKAFPERKVANRGIGGDVSRGALFRFKEDVLDLNPKAVVILVGTNDLSAHANPAVVIKNITAILDQAKAHNPEMPVILCTIPPRNCPQAPTKPGALDDLNARIKTLAEEEERETVQVMDLHAALLNEDGTQNTDCFGKDQIHMNTKGYEIWAGMLKPVFVSLFDEKPESGETQESEESKASAS